MSGYSSNLLPVRSTSSIKRKRTSISPENRTLKSSRKQPTKSSNAKDRSLLTEKDKSYISTKDKKSRKSLISKDLDKLDLLINPPSENTILREEVKSLKKTVKKQNRTLNEVCEKILKERKDVKDLTEKFIDTKKKDSLITELKGRLELMQDQEISLLSELREQQKKSEDLYSKLNELEGQSKQETEEAKKYYKAHYSKRYKEDTEQYKVKIEGYEKEKEQLMMNLKELERIHEMEKMHRSVAESEANSYKVQLEVKTRENDVLKEEIRRLKEQVKEVQEGSSERQEIEELKTYIEELRQENEDLKVRGEESNREFQQIWQVDGLRRKNEEELHRKVEDLHKKMEEMEREVVKRDEQYANMETYYKERMETTARVQEQRRKEWSDIYNELLGEVRELKEGMNLLELENQRLQSTTRSRMFGDML